MDFASIEPAVRVTIDSLRAFGTEALVRAGLPEDGAATIVDVQLESNLRGQPTHNMGDIPGYTRRIMAGHINPRPSFRIVRQTGVSLLLDGDNGPGQWVAAQATKLAIDKAKEQGVAIVGVNHSNHFGASGHYAWMAADAGLIGLATTDG